MTSFLHAKSDRPAGNICTFPAGRLVNPLGGRSLSYLLMGRGNR